MFENRLIFDTIVGSRAYGTNLPDSDTDTVAIAIPTEEYFYSYRRFDQSTGKTSDGGDRVIYNLVKTVQLMKDCNPNMIELLFSPERCVQLNTKYWQAFIDIRDLFLSKKCKFTYAGYAFSQVSRIKVHRKFLLDPPKGKPNRKDFGLPEVSVFPQDQLDAIVNIADDFFLEGHKTEMNEELQQIYSLEILPVIRRHLRGEYLTVAMDFFKNSIKNTIFSLNAIGKEYLKDEYKEMAVKELWYDAEFRKWKRFTEWQKSRNKKRAVLEEKVGYDPKHAMHVIRLYRQAEEILTKGTLIVDRTGIDAEELKEIRQGGWTYEKVEAYSNEMNAKLDALYKTSTLRQKPDDNKINETLVEVVKEYLHNMNNRCTCDKCTGLNLEGLYKE
jgi:predicted nucleotidyltransferase